MNQWLFVLITILSIQSQLFAAQPAVFHLYSQPNPQVDLSCDLFRELKLEERETTTGIQKMAYLENKLEGNCEVAYPKANSRNYVILSETKDECGTRILKGISLYPTRIEITDYSRTTCEFVIPALVVVKEEQLRGEAPITFYGIKP